MYNEFFVSIGQFTVEPTAFKTEQKIRELIVFHIAKKLTCSSPYHLHCQDVTSLKMCTRYNYIVGDCMAFFPSAHVFVRLL